MELSKRLLYIFFVLLLMDFAGLLKNCFAITSQELMGKYIVKKVEQFKTDGSYYAVELGKNQYAYGWFTLKHFKIKIDTVVAGEKFYKDEAGVYTINNNTINMTTNSGSSKDSILSFENGYLHVQTDYKDSKGYDLSIYLKKITSEPTLICKEMGLGSYWYNNECHLMPVNSNSPYIKSGWNLKSIPKDSNIEISYFSKEGIITIWKWNNIENKWEIWSPLLNIQELITKYNLSFIKFINYGEGFWVNSSNSIQLYFSGDNYDISYIINNIKEGWNLLGIGDNISVNSLKDSGLSFKTVWKWDAEKYKWLIWSSYNNIMNIVYSYGLESFDKIFEGEGFWINY